ncbi:MAG: SiaB family protein kinase [Cytophagales bacterium]|nr:SiaB family protein kinase [Bernardetiaceae bacterium]MDW8205275.1 SiaB family protein kinase [Cytophagales bacterium]
MDIQRFYEQFRSEDIIMSYKGSASIDLLSNLMDTLQIKLSEIEPKSSVRKRVFNVLVEVIQNIYHHYGKCHSQNAYDEETVNFLIAKTDANYFIIAGNTIFNEEIPMLRSRIDLINSLSPDRLKQVYMQTLSNGVLSEKGGAGLGLIEIARKSGGKLDYEFYPLSNRLSFFSLMVKIPAALPAAA